jgi:spermidine/putrescine transport system ATP-binding protein
MSPGDIRLVGLVKRFGDAVAVNGIDLHVPPGEFFTMLGPSGCGSTAPTCRAPRPTGAA